jgi:hypothetical protein
MRVEMKRWTMAPGADPLITPEMDEWLKQTILTCTPIKFGYDTNLWTCQILVKLIEQEFGGTVGNGQASPKEFRINLSTARISRRKKR